jgi:hypothetical protein
MVGAVQQRRRETVRVAAVGDLADELVDQVAAVSEDQDATGARGLDEADGCDRLAGAGGVLEPEAAVGPGVLRGLLDDVLVLLALPVLGLLLLGGLFLVLEGLALAVGCRSVSGLRLGGGRGRGAAVAVPCRGAAVEPLLDVGDQRGERARERIDLMSRELGAVREVGLLLGEQPLEAEHEREVAPPLDRGRLATVVDLDQGRVEGPAAGRPRGQVLRGLALEQERLPRELAGAFDVGAARRLRRFGGRLGRLSHLRLFDLPLLANRKDGEAHLA